MIMKISFAFLLCTWTAAAADGFVSLMPKQDISEHWTVEGKTPAEAWYMRDGAIATTGQPNGFLRSKQRYRNYILRAEWRFQEGYEPRPGDEGWPNAGFFIHANETKDGWPVSIEVQGHFGEAGSLFGVRGAKITGAKRGPIVKERPRFGDWDKYEITSKDGTVTVVLNGVLVNEGRNAMPAEGNICLQSEGWPVFYRNVEIKELP
ncbi:MAG: DUF1080 domain-containing protein [Bryobacteraceae bacterium]